MQVPWMANQTPLTMTQNSPKLSPLAHGKFVRSVFWNYALQSGCPQIDKQSWGAAADWTVSPKFIWWSLKPQHDILWKGGCLWETVIVGSYHVSGAPTMGLMPLLPSLSLPCRSLWGRSHLKVGGWGPQTSPYPTVSFFTNSFNMLCPNSIIFCKYSPPRQEVSMVYNIEMNKLKDSRNGCSSSLPAHTWPWSRFLLLRGKNTQALVVKIHVRASVSMWKSSGKWEPDSRTQSCRSMCWHQLLLV